jgi:hypothetical protein
MRILLSYTKTDPASAMRGLVGGGEDGRGTGADAVSLLLMGMEDELMTVSIWPTRVGAESVLVNWIGPAGSQQVFQQVHHHPLSNVERIMH